MKEVFKVHTSKNTGRRFCIVYACQDESKVGNEDGTQKVDAIYGDKYKNGYGEIFQEVFFVLDNVKMSGELNVGVHNVINAVEVVEEKAKDYISVPRLSAKNAAALSAMFGIAASVGYGLPERLIGPTDKSRIREKL